MKIQGEQQTFFHFSPYWGPLCDSSSLMPPVAPAEKPDFPAAFVRGLKRLFFAFPSHFLPLLMGKMKSEEERKCLSEAYSLRAAFVCVFYAAFLIFCVLFFVDLKSKHRRRKILAFPKTEEKSWGGGPAVDIRNPNDICALIQFDFVSNVRRCEAHFMTALLADLCQCCVTHHADEAHIVCHFTRVDVFFFPLYHLPIA